MAITRYYLVCEEHKESCESAVLKESSTSPDIPVHVMSVLPQFVVAHSMCDLYVVTLNELETNADGSLLKGYREWTG